AYHFAGLHPPPPRGTWRRPRCAGAFNHSRLPRQPAVPTRDLGVPDAADGAGGSTEEKMDQTQAQALGDPGAPPSTMRQLLEAGVHFGHNTGRWNPKMKQYIFGARNGIHIIDLQHTVKMFRAAFQAVIDITSRGEQVLFVGTKKQAQD